MQTISDNFQTITNYDNQLQIITNSCKPLQSTTNHTQNVQVIQNSSNHYKQLHTITRTQTNTTMYKQAQPFLNNNKQLQTVADNYKYFTIIYGTITNISTILTNSKYLQTLKLNLQLFRQFERIKHIYNQFQKRVQTLTNSYKMIEQQVQYSKFKKYKDKQHFQTITHRIKTIHPIFESS